MYVPEKDVKQIATEIALWVLDIEAINRLGDSKVPTEVVVKEKIGTWIKDRLKQVQVHPDQYAEELAREAFYDGREIADFRDGWPIYERPTFEGYLRELDKKNKK